MIFFSVLILLVCSVVGQVVTTYGRLRVPTLTEESKDGLSRNIFPDVGWMCDPQAGAGSH